MKSEAQRQAEPPAVVTATPAELFAQYRKKTVRDLPWRAMAALFAVVTVATFGLIYLKNAHARGTLPGFLQGFWPSSGLNLNISTSGDRFQLSWNRAIPVVKNARDAVLEINDGPNHHQIRLGGGEVANGSVLYLPNTDDIIFRLEVHGAAGQNLSESLRVVGTSKSSVLEVSRPTNQGDDPQSGGPFSPPEKVAINRPKAGGRNAVSGQGLSPMRAKSERARARDSGPATPVASEPVSVPGPAVAKSSDIILPQVRKAVPRPKHRRVKFRHRLRHRRNKARQVTWRKI